MPLYTFGSGTLWGKTTDTVPQIISFGTLQEISVDINASAKQLYGNKQYPVAVGRGTAKISGKAKFADLNADQIGRLFFGVTPTTGSTKYALEEAGTIPTTPFTVTVTNSATWSEDAGVKFTSTGIPLTRVASAPATGQYSVAAGVYTFAAADTGKAVKISYKYTDAANGKKLVVPNQLLGVAPTFAMTLENRWSNNAEMLTLYSCLANKFSFGTKLEDFKIPEFDFDAMADSSDNIMEWSFSS